MSIIKAKHQRLVLIIIAMAAIIVAALLAAWALRSEASFFYLPQQMAEAPPAPDRLVRLGGMVADGSLETMADGITVSFTVKDESAAIPVRYTGILPDLFVENSGAVADGRLGTDGVFVAETLLAKHDENYVPVELQDMTQHQKKEAVAETLVTAGARE